MVLSPYITQLLENRCGREIRRSSDCEFLVLDIESVSGEHIGVNTMKRMLGFISDERTPRISTLDVIARYLGFAGWEVLRLHDDKSNSDFGIDTDEVKADTLPIGQHIRITYTPDREITVEYLGDGCFHVLFSKNSKLEQGDEILLTHLVRGYPLLVSKVMRDGKCLGAFTAGKERGVNFELL